MREPVWIGKRLVGPGHPCLIIAEAGVNHNGDMHLAHRLIEAACEAGADAVKFQSYVTEELVTREAQKADYQTRSTGGTGGQYEMLKALELDFEQQESLKTHCDRLGIMYLCTPYDGKSVEMLDRLDVGAYKIASTDTTNIPMLHQIARKGRPVMLSTGMSTLGEVESAVDALRAGGLEEKLVLLQCTAEYPAPMEEVNLRAMETLVRAFLCPVGFSDHTPGVGASPWAVALGADVVEKHFTLDRRLAGPDHQASLEPEELRQLVKTVREVEAALGDGVKRLMPSESGNKSRMRKSLVAARRIHMGEVIVPEALTCKRPGTGLPPIWFDKIVGREAARDIEVGELIKFNDFAWE